MSPRQKLTAAMLVLTALATGMAWRFKGKAEASRAEINVVVRNLAEATNHNTRLRAGLLDATAAEKKLRADGSSATAKTESNKPVHRGWLELLESDPKFQNRALASEHVNLKLRYGRLYRTLDLTPQQVEQFEDNEMHLQEGLMDLRSAAFTNGLSLSDPAAAAISKQLTSEHDAAQKDLLGENGYQQLKIFEDEMWPRAMVSTMAGAALVAGAPLSSDQVARLNSLVIQASQSSGSQPAPDPGELDWNSIANQGSSFLTPSQIEFIESGDANGPLGTGGRFQNRLNFLISRGAQEDEAKGVKAAAVGQ